MTDTIPNKLTYRKIDQLKNWDKNPRSISPEGFERLKKQIKKLGQYKPLLITDDGTVLGGNMRLRAYRDLGIDDVWVSVVDAPDEEAKMRYALSDNDRAGFYDEDLLANLTGEYPDFNWEDYAVDLKEPQTLDDLIKSLTPVEEDDVPEVSDEPAVSEYGKVYQLGRHKLMCGDSTKIEDVEMLMDGKKADMVFTDPPYALFGNSTGVAGITDDKMTRPFFLEIFRALKRSTKQFGHIYTFCDWHSAFSLQAMARESGLTEKNLCIWDKGDGGVGAMYQQCYEMVWFHANSPIATKTMGKTKSGERTVNGKPNIWRFGRENNERVHNAQKPIEMISFAIKNSSDDGNIILDLFLGSGSTLIACEQTNRTCYGMEIDPKYTDVIRKRWVKFVHGEEAVADGRWIDLTPTV